MASLVKDKGDDIKICLSHEEGDFINYRLDPNRRVGVAES